MNSLDKGGATPFCFRLVKPRPLLSLVLLLSAYLTQAQSPLQEADTLKVTDSLSVFPEKIKTYGFWVGGYLEPAYSTELNGVNGGFGGVFVYREQFHLGIYGVTYLGGHERHLIFPNQFTFHYSHAGIWGGVKTRLRRSVDLTADLRIGEGKLFWERNDNFYNQFEDYALFIAPSIGADVRFLKFFALHGAVGYRKVHGIEIPGFSDTDFSGINLLVMLKIGWL